MLVLIWVRSRKFRGKGWTYGREVLGSEASQPVMSFQSTDAKFDSGPRRALDYRAWTESSQYFSRHAIVIPMCPTLWDFRHLGTV